MSLPPFPPRITAGSKTAPDPAFATTGRRCESLGEPDGSYCSASIRVGDCSCDEGIGRKCLFVNRAFSTLFVTAACTGLGPSSSCLDLRPTSPYYAFVNTYALAGGFALSAQLKGYTAHIQDNPEAQWFVFPNEYWQYDFAPPLYEDDPLYCLPFADGATPVINKVEIWENALSQYTVDLGVLSSPTGPGCEKFHSMTDLRALSPPEWCNAAEERRFDAALCEASYVRVESPDGDLPRIDAAACFYDKESRKCLMSEEWVSGCVAPPPPPPPLGVGCELFAGRTDLQSMETPEWCNADVSRQNDKAECENACISWEAEYGRGARTYQACVHAGSSCVATGAYTDCTRPPLCDALENMQDTKSLDPPQWCGTDPARSASAEACGGHFVSFSDSERVFYSRCVMNNGICSMAPDRYVC